METLTGWRRCFLLLGNCREHRSRLLPGDCWSGRFSTNCGSNDRCCIALRRGDLATGSRASEPCASAEARCRWDGGGKRPVCRSWGYRSARGSGDRNSTKILILPLLVISVKLENLQYSLRIFLVVLPGNSGGRQ